MEYSRIALNFGNRLMIATMYQHWIEENGLKDCATNVIAFMQINDLLNQEQCIQFVAPYHTKDKTNRETRRLAKKYNKEKNNE